MCLPRIISIPTHSPIPLFIPYTPPHSEQAFVFRKDSADLQAEVDEALATLREDGTLARISEEYFGEDVSGE